MTLPQHLEGYGMTVRTWRPGDEDLLHRAIVESTEHLRPWMEWIREEPRTAAQRRATFLRWEEERRAGGDGIYGVFLDGAVAGGCGLHHRLGPHGLEIGYWTHAAFVRRGVATGASRLLTDAAFAMPSIEYVEIHHDKANLASRGVPEGLGYELLGERPDPRDTPAEVGIECVWRMTRSRWLDQQHPSEPPRGG
ncbi:MAG TPA: GNAT family N-acetyltransferase [Solirubrobacteraceae bacterium]|nr:GNAT family N-acetyltransferase [Solirubrobacteraceae bacterium]